MTLEELYSKWFVRRGEVDAVIVNLPDKPTFKKETKFHNAPLGDFMKEYIDHLAIPWYKRRWDWKFVEAKMRETLNVLQVEFVGESPYDTKV